MTTSNSGGFIHLPFRWKTLAIVLMSLTTTQVVSAQKIEYLQPVPLKNAISTTLSPVKKSNAIKVPITTAGGDILTINASESGFFQSQGLNISLFKEDSFKNQIEKCLSGETPYLRGTMGMMNSAIEIFRDRGTDLVMIYQLSWSEGSYAMVVKKDKTLKNIDNVALQLYGPHMHYASNLFSTAGRLNEITFKWLADRTMSAKTQSRITDPVSAFKSDPSVDAVMCMITDALTLTSNGTAGTGENGSVKDATILISTKTASRIIADVYAVRKDYFDAHKDEVMKFVKAMMLADESLQRVKKNKSDIQSQQLISIAADILFGLPDAAADAKALMQNCSYAGFNGNVAFFTGKGTLRNMTTLSNEIQDYLFASGLIEKKGSIPWAEWDYNELSQGLINAGITFGEKKFDLEKAEKKLEEKISVESAGWEKGTLFTLEINFTPNQQDFPATLYAEDFRKALEMAQTYSGALIVIEGHSSPYAIYQAEKAGEEEALIVAKKQKAKDLSEERAENVRKNFIAYAHDNGLHLDESQIIALGFGISHPKYPHPETEEQWNDNSRVVFRVKEIEAEMEEFIPDNSTSMHEASNYRGVVNETPAEAAVAIGEYYALIVGINEYSGAWVPLNNAVNDAKAIEQALSQYYRFDHFKALYDKEATGENIIHGLEWLVDNVKANDNVLIYFSGHGHFNKALDKGYWVPIDAQTTSTAHFISNSVIQDFVKGINSKHTLLLSDACFSGDIFRGVTNVEHSLSPEKYVNKMYSLKSRQAISSGGLEPVMDGGKDGHSVFTYYLLQALQNNDTQYMDAEQLYSAIKVPVVNNSSQSPIFSPVHSTGDEGGQFLFIKK